MPDPFRFEDGSRVAVIPDWEQRREEIRDQLLALQYGTMPCAPAQSEAASGPWETLEGGRKRRSDTLTLVPDAVRPDVRIQIVVRLTYPSDGELAAARQRCPGFDDEGLPAIVYVGRKAHEAALCCGYVVISYPNDTLEPMEEGRAIRGPARAAYDDLYGENAFTWGSIAAWAWGAHRVIDHVVGLPGIDATHLAITGHSRNGKAALLAGALDERCAIVNPAGSGCAGAGSYLVLGPNCEDLAALTDSKRWWAWTQPTFNQFAGREAALPFDQHFLMALVAPRPLLRTEGEDDAWANPLGTSASFLATQPVYNFLGAPDANTIHYRPGGHEQTEADMAVLIDLCDETFFGAQRSVKLNRALDGVPECFEWSAPLVRA